MEIIKNLTTQNFNSGTVSRIKYIVVHYTGNNGDTALGNTNYFKTYRGASAHYFVDESSVYQSIEDKNIAWHCGANTYYHNECRNHNSIGVEMCSYINDKGKYAFKEKTVNNALQLIKELMEKYNVPIENIVRHYDVTHKVCPAPYVNDSKAWTSFKKKLAEKIQEDDEMIEQITVNINGKNYKADRILKEDKNFLCIKDLEQAGFNIGYDTNTKTPSITNANKELQITVDGKETSVEAVNINGSNYVPIRSISAATGTFEVDFKDGKVVIKTK
jgi:N-acetylmuramoyl-L-alanine amidase